MNKSFQRTGSKSNAYAGRAFEIVTQKFFATKGLILKSNISLSIGIESLTKKHSFDLGCLNPKVIIECKSHKWTSGKNVPSAKLTIWNEAMYYFLLAPKEYRMIMFVLRDYSQKRQETLAEYYIRTYRHLIPNDVEFWEYNEDKQSASRLL